MKVDEFKEIMTEIGINTASVEEYLIKRNTRRISIWLSALIAWRGLSGAEVARRLGRTRQTVYNWTVGRTVPSFSDFLTLWVVLDCGDAPIEEVRYIYYDFADT